MCVCLCVCVFVSARAHVCVCVYCVCECGNIQSFDYVSLVCIIVFNSNSFCFSKGMCVKLCNADYNRKLIGIVITLIVVKQVTDWYKPVYITVGYSIQSKSVLDVENYVFSKLYIH